MICLAVTALFGIIGIPSFVMAIRKKKYPKQVEFYVLDLVRIISPLVRKYDSIKLLHNDKETKNVSFLRGMFVCVGDEDVELKAVENRGGMQVSLPDGYRWLEVHPQERTKGLDVNCAIDEQFPNIMYVTSELFKRDEAFTFDAYIEGKDDDRLVYSKLKVEHRISNMGIIKTQKIDISRTKSSKKKLWSIGFMCVMYIVLAVAMSYGMMYDRPIRYVDKQGENDIYSISLISCDSVAISKGRNGILPWRNKHLSIDEFTRDYSICTEFYNPAKREVGMFVFGPGLGCLLLIVLLLILMVLYRRDKRTVKAYTRICNGRENGGID